jgi:hypothetical protein
MVQKRKRMPNWPGQWRMKMVNRERSDCDCDCDYEGSDSISELCISIRTPLKKKKNRTGFPMHKIIQNG